MKIILLLFISVLSKLYLPIRSIEKQLGSEQNDTVVAVSNYQNIAYTVQVSIGTPGQIFELLLDTASSDIWVVDHACLNCNKPLNVFYPSQSTTFSDKLNPIHIDPQFSGAEALLSTDNVEIQELTVTGQTFALVVSDLAYQGANWDGVLGLGFNNTSSSNLIQNLYNQGLIEQPLFSLYLNNDEDDDSPNSALVLGGVDEEFYESGTFTYFPLLGDQNIWSVYLSSVEVASLPISFGGEVLFDIGTSLIFAPETDYHAISEIFRLNYGCIEGDQVLCPCSDFSNYPNITFKLGSSSSYSIPPEAYFTQNSTTGSCVLLLGQSSTSAPIWVLGTVFLREYYTTFSMQTDYNAAQIGLAQLKVSHHRRHHSGGSTSSDDDDLLGLKIGLPIGGVIAIGAAGTVICCCILKRRKAKKAKENKDNQQKLIIYVGGDVQRPPEVPSFIESVDEHYQEVKPIVVVNDPDKNTQTVFYPYLPPVADS
ncbi:CYM_4 [Blepharisma stoltei]|uniref:Peptidase A1 domain-containing protein n=1 Tax=Blepharisma stoltei TaxID=1481888 RepID=A0AAU9IEI9_9CILI|nr:unnamed protein product [Blepharisma stoltei]